MIKKTIKEKLRKINEIYWARLIISTAYEINHILANICTGVWLYELNRIKKVLKHIYLLIIYYLIQLYAFIIVKFRNNIKLINIMGSLLVEKSKEKTLIHRTKKQRKYKLLYKIKKLRKLHTLLADVRYCFIRYWAITPRYVGKTLHFNLGINKYTKVIFFRKNVLVNWTVSKTKQMRKHWLFKDPLIQHNLSLPFYNLIQKIWLSKLNFLVSFLLFILNSNVTMWYRLIINTFFLLKWLIKLPFRIKKIILKKSRKMQNRKRQKTLKFLKFINKFEDLL